MKLFAFGVPAELLLHFAKDKVTAKFAIEKGAGRGDYLALNELFAYACEAKDKELITYLHDDLTAIGSYNGIEDYYGWNRDCELQAEGNLPEADQKKYHPSQLGPTPFESYLIFLQASLPEGQHLDRSQLAEALHYFNFIETRARELEILMTLGDFFLF